VFGCRCSTASKSVALIDFEDVDGCRNVSVRTFLDVYKSLMRQPTVDSIIHCMDRLQSRSVSPLFEYVCAVAYLEICKGGGGRPEYLATLFLGRRPTSRIPVPKNFYDFFLVTFHIFSTSLRRPPQKPSQTPPTAPRITAKGGGRSRTASSIDHAKGGGGGPTTAPLNTPLRML
jgi:hypothetical protein